MKERLAMYDINNLTLDVMRQCGSTLSGLGNQAKSMEEVADKVVHYLYEHMEADGEKAFALVRFYKTHPYASLDPQLQEHACKFLDTELSSSQIKCFTMLATAGNQTKWESRKNTIKYDAIPLTTEGVKHSIMTGEIIRQFGLDLGSVMNPDSKTLAENEDTQLDVFYLSEALGSPFIPQQAEFVVPYGIKSILGFGGILPARDLFAVIMFSKVYVSRHTAEMFSIFGPDVKAAIRPFADKAVFTKEPVPAKR